MARTDHPPATARRRGPLPALDPETERGMILVAATRVLRRSGFHRATLDEVLTEASLSTRSFYRHFSSKDELLVALHRQEGAAVAASMRKRIAVAPTATDALEAWVDDLLAIAYEPRRAARAGLLRSSISRDAAGWDEAHRAVVGLMTAPLVELLQRGHEDGTFPTADPETDARAIFTLTFGMMNDLRGRVDRSSRARTRSLVLRYAHPPLGVPAARPDGG